MPDRSSLTPAGALYIASRMEQRAIRLYERALLVFSQEQLKKTLEGILQDERVHLSAFQELLEKEEPVSAEEALILDAQAGTFLFQGGLTGAVREGAFDSLKSLLTFAADEEESAASRYAEYALRAQGRAKDTFLDIASQERRHLDRLKEQILLLKEEKDA